jgi:hypothetical protein
MKINFKKDSCLDSVLQTEDFAVESCNGLHTSVNCPCATRRIMQQWRPFYRKPQRAAMAAMGCSQRVVLIAAYARPPNQKLRQRHRRLTHLQPRQQPQRAQRAQQPQRAQLYHSF